APTARSGGHYPAVTEGGVPAETSGFGGVPSGRTPRRPPSRRRSRAGPSAGRRSRPRSAAPSSPGPRRRPGCRRPPAGRRRRARRGAWRAGGAETGRGRGVDPRGRFGRRAGLQEGVSGGGEFQEQGPAAEADPDVVEDRAPAIVGQHAEGEFAEQGLDLVAAGHGFSSAASSRARTFRRPRRMRVLAVPSGMPSDPLISSAVRP